MNFRYNARNIQARGDNRAHTAATTTEAKQLGAEKLKSK